MAKAKDFYGKEVTAVIEDACRDFGVSQEELDIEVLETGSAGIFGLCKKKAHIRVRRKQVEGTGKAVQTEDDGPGEKSAAPEPPAEPAHEEKKPEKKKQQKQRKSPADKAQRKQENGPAPGKQQSGSEEKVPPAGVSKNVTQESIEPPDEQAMESIRQIIAGLLELMNCPAEIKLTVEGTSLNCHLQSEHEELLVGTDGRTLDSLQYLLRKMISPHLPDRMMLALDAGDFRERRAEELKTRARELAEEVRETGKTQAIPALNPAERRVVHMVLQEDKTIRSRSVGDGLFKKVLIYKPGKGGKSPSRKRRGRQGGRSSEN